MDLVARGHELGVGGAKGPKSVMFGGDDGACVCAALFDACFFVC